MGTRRRIGFVGGTFDPPHVGHLALARSARDAFDLDEVRLVPTGRSWQKAAAGASSAQRLEMTRLLLRDLPASERLVVDEREVRRDGPTYTVDTLRELRAELGPEPALVWVIGSDQLRNLHTWHRWHELFEHGHVAATQREGAIRKAAPARTRRCLARQPATSVPAKAACPARQAAQYAVSVRAPQYMPSGPMKVIVGQAKLRSCRV